MKRQATAIPVLCVVAALSLLAWLVVPGPFGHGVIVGFLAALGSFVGGLVVFGRIMRRRLSGTLKPPPLPTGSRDYSMDLRDLEGATVSLSHSAGKVLVLNFWATWCAPCIAELPSLRRLLEQTADLDVQFGFITREDPPVVRQFVEKRGIDLPIYVLSGEPPECFKARAIPATFVLDQAGRIAMRHFGAAAWDADNVVAFVRGLAAKPAEGADSHLAAQWTPDDRRGCGI